MSNPKEDKPTKRMKVHGNKIRVIREVDMSVYLDPDLKTPDPEESGLIEDIRKSNGSEPPFFPKRPRARNR